MFGALEWGIVQWLWIAYSTALIGAVALYLQPGWKPWYDGLHKAPWNLPIWMLSVGCFIQYTLHGTASYLVWRDFGSGSEAVYHASVAFALLTMLTYGMWAPIFYGLRMIRLALLVQGVVLLVASACCGLFFVRSTTAGALLVPELAWLLYEATLNAYVVWHNDVDDTPRHMAMEMTDK